MPVPFAFPRCRAASLLAGGLLAVGSLAPRTAARAETLTLAQCLRETAEHNPDILEQRRAVERALASRLTLRARALPTLTAGGTLGALNQEENVKEGSVQTKTDFIALATGSLYQPLFDAAVPASYRRGTLGVLAAEQNFYSVASTQLHAARLGFYRALYQQQNGEILRQTDAVFAGNVQSQSQLVTAGLEGRAALLSAQVQRANVGPELLAAAGTYRTGLASLLQTMGRALPRTRGNDDPLARIVLGGSLDETARGFDAADALRVALERRPDLRSLRAMVKMNQEDANIARAGYYPLVRLYLAGELIPESNVRNRPNAIRQSDQQQTTELRPGITGSWNVIDTGGTRGAVRAQEAARDTVQISLKRLETNLPSELATVRARLTDASGRLDALRGNVDAAQNTLNIIQGGVAQGLNTQTEFYYAQNDLLAIRTGLLAARLEMSLAHAELDRLTGNYLRYVEPDPAPAARRPATK